MLPQLSFVPSQTQYANCSSSDEVTTIDDQLLLPSSETIDFNSNDHDNLQFEYEDTDHHTVGTITNQSDPPAPPDDISDQNNNLPFHDDNSINSCRVDNNSGNFHIDSYDEEDKSDDDKSDEEDNCNENENDLPADDNQLINVSSLLADPLGSPPSPGLIDASLMAFSDAIQSKAQHAFTSPEKAAIQLLQILDKCGARLGLFDDIMKWAADSVKHYVKPFPLPPIKRSSLIHKLSQKYGLDHSSPIANTISLPGSNKDCQIITSSFRHSVFSILNNPVLMQEKNLIFKGPSPTTPPTRNPDFIDDIDTGSRYIDSWNHLCTQPNDVLCPVEIYIDKTFCDAKGKLNSEPVTFTLGIFNRKAKYHTHFWRTLGYIPNAHLKKATKQKGDKSHDYHACLEHIFCEMAAVMNSAGITWTIFFKGKTHYVKMKFCILMVIGDNEGQDKLCSRYNCHSSMQLKRQCRYCDCPTDQLDNPDVITNYIKSIEIQAVVGSSNATEKMNALKDLSIHPTINAFWSLNLGNCPRGIYGNTPYEKLHGIQQGLHQYLRAALFGLKKLDGHGQKNAKRRIKAVCKINNKNKRKHHQDDDASEQNEDQEINDALEQIPMEESTTSSSRHVFSESMCSKVEIIAAHFMNELRHQSLRDLPRTMFAQGITANHSMIKGCEEQGILLLMILVMSCSAGSQIFVGDQRPQVDIVTYSKVLGTMERMISFEEFLEIKTPLHRRDIDIVSGYIPALMQRYKETVSRTEGMGLKIIKFHMLLHLTDDIKRHGLPSNYDSGPGEARHKDTVKKPSVNTQRRFDSFDQQIGNRHFENTVVHYAIAQLGTSQSEKPDPPFGQQECRLGDSAPLNLLKNTLGNVTSLDVAAVTKIHPYDHFPIFFHNATDHLRLHICKALLDHGIDDTCTLMYEATMDNVNYRAHPNFRQTGRWYDWALVKSRRGNTGCITTPSRICLFYQIPTSTPLNGVQVVFSDSECMTLSHAPYAIVQCFAKDPFGLDNLENEEEYNCSQHPELLNMHCEELDTNHFYHVPLTDISGPCAVVEDVSFDSANNRVMRTGLFTLIHSRQQWATNLLRRAYKYYLDDPGNDDVDTRDHALLSIGRSHKERNNL